jgi:hypothetical protein
LCFIVSGAVFGLEEAMPNPLLNLLAWWFGVEESER